MIPYGRQHITEDDIAAVDAVLRSDWLTQGPAVPAFEAAVAARVGARHAVAVSSATAALHVACLALGLGPGDVLWTSPITFVASANCARYCGADVDFCDIDPATGNLCPDALAAKLADAERNGRLPKVVVAVHLCGAPCDMARLEPLAERYGFALIEDASHAVGGHWRGEPIGSGRHSAVTVFSFHPVKLITTGEGGMALTQDAALARRMTLLRSHGITRDPAEMQTPPEGEWCYEQQTLGFNYRLTDLQAALGLSQLARLDTYVAQRGAWAERYRRALADLPLKLPAPDPRDGSAWHLYVVGVAPGARLGRAELFKRLRQAGVGVNVHYTPVHLQPYYRQLGFGPGQFPHAEDWAARCISLPLFPGLTEAQHAHVVATLQRELAP